MIPCLGKRLTGKRRCRFRLDLRRGLVHVQVLGWKRRARNVIQLGIQFKEIGIDGDPTHGKKKGEETSNPMVNTISAKGKQSHQPPTSSLPPKKQKQLTSNIQHALRNQRRELTNLLIDNISLLLRRFSFARRACLSPTDCCARSCAC